MTDIIFFITYITAAFHFPYSILVKTDGVIGFYVGPLYRYTSEKNTVMERYDEYGTKENPSEGCIATNNGKQKLGCMERKRK